MQNVIAVLSVNSQRKEFEWSELMNDELIIKLLLLPSKEIQACKEMFAHNWKTHHKVDCWLQVLCSNVKTPQQQTKQKSYV